MLHGGCTGCRKGYKEVQRGCKGCRLQISCKRPAGGGGKAKSTMYVMDCPPMVMIVHFSRTWQFDKEVPGTICAGSLMPAHQAALCAYLQLQRFRAALPAA